MRFLVLALVLCFSGCSSPTAPSGVTPKPQTQNLVSIEVLAYSYASYLPLTQAEAVINGTRYRLPATVVVEAGSVSMVVGAPYHYESRASGDVFHSGERWTFWLVPAH